MNDCMLFLNSVEEIKLRSNGFKSCTLTSTYSTKIEFGDDAKERRERIKIASKNAARSLKNKDIRIELVDVTEEAYELTTVDSSEL
jgi:hypothetical protein